MTIIITKIAIAVLFGWLDYQRGKAGRLIEWVSDRVLVSAIMGGATFALVATSGHMEWFMFLLPACVLLGYSAGWGQYFTHPDDFGVEIKIPYQPEVWIIDKIVGLQRRPVWGNFCAMFLRHMFFAPFFVVALWHQGPIIWMIASVMLSAQAAGCYTLFSFIQHKWPEKGLNYTAYAETCRGLVLGACIVGVLM